MEPIHIETMNAPQATEYLRSCGLRISPDTLRKGIAQGQFPFGTCVMNGEKVLSCTIYVNPMLAWIKERA